MADSSTLAMPSMTSPSPGMMSPASHDDPVALLQLRRRHRLLARRRRSSRRGDGVGLGPAQRVGLGLAPALGDRLGQVGEQHRQPQPDR